MHSSLAAQNADEMDRDNLPKIESTPQGPSVFSSGFSIDVNWDDRDFVPNPRQGQYADLRYTHYAPGLGSDTRFDEWHLHYSRYTALSENGNPTLDTINKVLHAVGLRLSVTPAAHA